MNQNLPESSAIEMEKLLTFVQTIRLQIYDCQLIV